MKSLCILLLYLGCTTNASLTVNTTFKACITTSWEVHIHNKINDPIIVHVKSNDDDLGNRTLPFNGSRDWSFCSKANGRTVFSSNFYWKSKIASFDVFTNPIGKKYCANSVPFKVQKCNWLVKEDGFYISKKVDNPSPHKLHDWS